METRWVPNPNGVGGQIVETDGDQSTTRSAGGASSSNSVDYFTARAAGDWQGMQAANDRENAARAARGEAPQYATEDIELIRRQSEQQAQQVYQTRSNYDHTDEVRRIYAAQVENALAGLKGAYSKSMAEYDAVLDLLPQRYQGYRNDAAAQAAIAQKNFDERAAASGLNSGSSGQAALDASAVYRGTLGQLDQAQANAAAEIDRAKADLRAQYETAVAQAKASGDASLAQAIYQELIRGDSLAREDRRDALAQQNWQSEFDFNKEQTAKNWEYTYQQDQKADALSSALTLAGQGRFEALGACYNWDDETVQYMTEQYWTAKKKAEHDEAMARAQWMADNMIEAGLVPDEELLEQAGYTMRYARPLAEARARFNAGQ